MLLMSLSLDGKLSAIGYKVFSTKIDSFSIAVLQPLVITRTGLSFLWVLTIASIFPALELFGVINFFPFFSYFLRPSIQPIVHVSFKFQTRTFIKFSRYINMHVIMKTMCLPSYHHNGFVATDALGHRMYGYTLLVQMNQIVPNKLSKKHNISPHKWSTTHRLLKSLRNKMSIIYMYIHNTYNIHVILMYICIYNIYIYIYNIYIYIYLYIYIHL